MYPLVWGHGGKARHNPVQSMDGILHSYQTHICSDSNQGKILNNILKYIYILFRINYRDMILIIGLGYAKHYFLNGNADGSFISSQFYFIFL